MQEEREDKAKLCQEELANRGNNSQQSFNSSKLHDSQRTRPRTPQSERDFESGSRDDSFCNSNGLKDQMKSPPVANDQPSRRPEAVGQVHPDYIRLPTKTEALVKILEGLWTPTDQLPAVVAQAKSADPG
ncbi:hypothetical protein BY996DRAFT_6423893 [Phakopsora pachyrhizi]|nr:hypothetical protein BY996DRAFT_6423893 [Phakopsora pachyrhizi]